MNADGSGKKQLTFAEPGDVNADPCFSHTEPERILYIHSEGLSGSFDMYRWMQMLKTNSWFFHTMTNY